MGNRSGRVGLPFTFDETAVESPSSCWERLKTHVESSHRSDGQNSGQKILQRNFMRPDIPGRSHPQRKDPNEAN